MFQQYKKYTFPQKSMDVWNELKGEMSKTEFETAERKLDSMDMATELYECGSDLVYTYTYTPGTKIKWLWL